MKPQQTEPPAPPSPGHLPLIVALFALLLGLAVAGWSWWSWQENETLHRGLRAELERARSEGAVLYQTLEAMRREAADQREALASRQGLLAETLASLRSRSGQLPPEAWRLAEARYLAGIAVHALTALESPETAAAALSDARARIERLAGPAVERVRTLIAADLSALHALPAAPRPALDHALDALQGQCDRLPLPLPEAPGPATPWSWEGDWRELGRAAWERFREVVVIRRADQAEEPLIAPAQEYYLRQNLRLQLERARLALYHADGEAWQAALGRARGWIGRYFDGDAPATRAALEELGRLERTELRRRLPQLGETLAALDRALTDQALEPALEPIREPAP